MSPERLIILTNPLHRLLVILVFAVGSIMMETDIGASFIIIMSALSVLAASGIKKTNIYENEWYYFGWS